MWRTPGSSATARAFTLIELLVSMAVLTLLMVMVFTLMGKTNQIWRDSTSKIEAFQNARIAFESLTRNLSQATLNTYYDYYDTGNKRVGDTGYTSPAIYGRYSELEFVSGTTKKLFNYGGATIKRYDGKVYSDVSPTHAVFFQAPIGYASAPSGALPSTASDFRVLDQQLNALGYYVEFGSDKDTLPAVLASKVTPRYRYRLMEFIQPSESLAVYSEAWASHTTGQGAKWFTDFLKLALSPAASARPTRVIGENVVGLIVRPKRSDTEWQNLSPKVALAPNYSYDSHPATADVAMYPAPTTSTSRSLTEFQLPPLVEVTLIAIDEPSAVRLQARYGANAPDPYLDHALPSNATLTPLAQLFQTAADPNDPTEYNRDLQSLKDRLAAEHINYRVFDTEVVIRASKWTEN